MNENENQDFLDELEETVFGIVSYAGEAKGYAYEALEMSEKGEFDKVDELMEKSKQSILHAHSIQTDLIQKEAAGKTITINMLFVHAQDHIMTTMSVKELISKLITMNKRLYKIEEKLK